MNPNTFSRRSFLAFSAMLPWALSARGAAATLSLRPPSAVFRIFASSVQPDASTSPREFHAG
jgi:uncharacterized protein (DUF1501 family)